MKKRWIHCEESYDDRMKCMVKFIKKNSSVLDLGCGNEHLKYYLPKSCKYQGCDLVKRSKNSIVCNFNKRELPPYKEYDYIVCSGLLEYITNLPVFLFDILPYTDKFIFSYAVKKTSKSNRESQDWINHLTKKQFFDLIESSNYEILEETGWNNQIIIHAKQKLLW